MKLSQFVTHKEFHNYYYSKNESHINYNKNSKNNSNNSIEEINLEPLPEHVCNECQINTESTDSQSQSPKNSHSEYIKSLLKKSKT